MNASKVALALGLSRRQLAALVDAEPDFPVLEVSRAGYRLWPREAIEAWRAQRPLPAPGYRPPAVTVAESRLHGTPERITPELQLIFELACSEAVSLNHYWVGPDHLVLALLHPECPGMARAVLRSFGLSLANAREAWVESMGDPYEPHKLTLAVPPVTRFPFERAKLEALDLRDEHVSSEHLLLDLINGSAKVTQDRELAERVITPRVMSSPQLLWRVQSSKSSPAILRMFLNPLGIDAEAVRDRVMALTEDPSRHFEPLEPPRRPRERRARWAGKEPQLALSPLGHHPDRRRTWGSGVFPNPDGNAGGIMQGNALLQYFIDRDGYPVLTTTGKPVHTLIDPQGNHVLDADGMAQLTVIDVPPGSRLHAYPREDRHR